MWVIPLTLFAVVFTLWIQWRRRFFSVFNQLGIPGPKPNIFFGNLWQISSQNPLVCHKKWVEKYGGIVGYYFGVTPVVLVTNTDALKKIQVSDFQKFINRARLAAIGHKKTKKNTGCDHQLTNLRDDRWREIRSTLTPSFTPNKLKQVTPTMLDAIDSLMENIDEKIKQGGSFDIYKLYQGLTMDVIGRTAFGIQLDCQQNLNDSFVRSANALFAGKISSWLTVLSLSFPEFDFILGKIARLSLRFRNQGVNPINELVKSAREVIKARRDNLSNRKKDLLQMMIDAQMTSTKTSDLTAGGDDVCEKNDETNRKPAKAGKLTRQMNDNEIVDNAVLFFLAGYESTSATLAFTTHFLLHYPEMQEKVRNEVKEVIKKEGSLNYTSVHQLQYLDQVITESLRMYPPLNLNVTREVAEDIEINNIQLKKGLAVQVPAYTLQHDGRYWQDPETFNPDRFSPENKGRNNPLAFQAFGVGPRNCVGMRFAQMEVKLALARILDKYRLLKCKETNEIDLELKISATTITPLKGINLKALPL